MQIAEITMSKHEAREKLIEYKRRRERVTNQEHAAEYDAIAKGLRQIQRGRKLIDLVDVFGQCPVDEKGRPKLAICRADMNQVEVSADDVTWDSENRRLCRGVRFHALKKAGRFVRAARGQTVQLSFSLGGRRFALEDGYALVPMVPIEHRPPRFDASKHFILWEVEQWADRVLGARADIDPYLLRHIGGTLYAVIAEWDLTPLERAVMNRRSL